MRLDGQIALVTGGAAGIGRAVVDAYIEAGARVGVLDRSAEALAELEAAHGDRVVAILGDASKWDSNRQAVEQTVEAFGGLDVLVGNAGIGDRAEPFLQLDPDRLDQAFDEIFAVNVKGYLLAAKAAHDELAKRSGAIIFTASFSSFAPAGGGALYVASKHAVAGVVRQLAYEFAPKIRVNAVAPGLAETSLGGLSSLGHKPASALLPGIEDYLPLNFVPSPSDHAPAYVLLAHPEASKVMTGAFISTDSGLGIRGIIQTSGAG